jgi:hypothetical protein
MAVNPIPDGFHSVTPFLNVKGAAELISFWRMLSVLRRSCECPAQAAW